MDCDYDPREQSRKELIALSNNKREKSRRKSVFAQKLETKKPIFDPTLYSKHLIQVSFLLRAVAWSITYFH